MPKPRPAPVTRMVLPFLKRLADLILAVHDWSPLPLRST